MRYDISYDLHGIYPIRNCKLTFQHWANFDLLHGSHSRQETNSKGESYTNCDFFYWGSFDHQTWFPILTKLGKVKPFRHSSYNRGILSRIRDDVDEQTER